MQLGQQNPSVRLDHNNQHPVVLSSICTPVNKDEIFLICVEDFSCTEMQSEVFDRATNSKTDLTVLSSCSLTLDPLRTANIFSSVQLKLDFWILTGKIISAHLAGINSDLQFTVSHFKARKPQSLVDPLMLHDGVLSCRSPFPCYGDCVVPAVYIGSVASFEEIWVTVGRWGCSPLAGKTHMFFSQVQQLGKHILSLQWFSVYVCVICCRSHVHSIYVYVFQLAAVYSKQWLYRGSANTCLNVYRYCVF